MNISDIKDKSKTLAQAWIDREGGPEYPSLTIQFSDDARLYMERFHFPCITVITRSTNIDAHLCVKFRVTVSYTIAQCVSIATALQELIRNPLAVCSVINEFIKPGSVAELETEEPAPPTIRTGFSHG